VEFEYDPQKSKSNKEKHGIDFEQAKLLWELPVLELASKYADESRKLAIGKIERKYWTAIFAERKGKIRIISVRRARANEKAFYKKVNENKRSES
jgi:uncharacterized DUF497 family protein